MVLLDPKRALKSAGFFSRFGTLFTACFLSLVLLTPGAGAKTPIRSAAEIDYPPFCFVDEKGKPSGFSVELMRAALESMGREVTFRIGPWAEVRSWLENGEVDALPLVGRTPERESLFDFTFPYMSLHGAIVVRKGTTNIRDMEDLKGRSVAVMKGDNAEEFLRRKDRGIEIHTTATFEEALQFLSEGRYDAVVIQRLVALRLIQETGIENLRVINTPIEGFRQDFCFAVKEKDRDTLALLNEGLSLVMADGTYRHLHAKWFAALELPVHRRIIVGGDRNYPPYEYLDENGRPAGFIVELTRAIAKEMGLDIEIRLGPWAKVVKALEEGDIDVIQGMFYSPRRDLKFDFTQAHDVNQYVAIVRKEDGPPPTSVEALKGKRIVIQRGDAIHDFLRKKGLKDEIALVETQEAVLRELAEGKHDYAVGVRISALYFIEKSGLTNLELARKPLTSMEYCYAVLNGQKALLASFSEGLKILEETGEYRRIKEKWLGVYREEKRSLIAALRYSAMVLVPLLVLLLGFFLWSWSLRRQVAARTAALQENERILNTTGKMGKIGGWEHDLITGKAVWTEALYDIIEIPYDQDPPGVDAHLGYYPENDRKVLENAYNTAVTEGIPFDLELQVYTATRKLLWCRAQGEPVFEDGKCIKLRGMSQDITEFKRARERIEHLNRVLRAIREVNQLIVRERDRETLIREAARLLVENRGYASALILLTDDHNRPFSWAGFGMGESLDALERILEKGELPPCCTHADASGTLLFVEERMRICKSCPIAKECAETDAFCVRLVHGGIAFGYLAAALEHGPGADPEEQSLFSEMADDLAYALHGIMMDAFRKKAEQESKSLEAQLVQAQKLESVGRLAGGVAHDFNNMLSVILGHAEMMLMKLNPGEAFHSDVEEIHKAARRSADLTRQLLAFARKQTIAPKVLDLNETVEGMLKMLRRLIGEDIDLLWKPDAHLWPVKMDPAQVDQILANLCVNARDAIAGVGKVTIETENVTLDENYCADRPGFIPGDFVMLAVSDNGRGMDKEVLDHMFEPFFTTKETGEGTGLGLATVYGIVKQNEGYINVYSEPGKGSTFRIYIPRYAGEEIEAAASMLEDIPRGNKETILLVEDEPAIMGMGKMMLEKLGYQVLAAGTPKEALRLAVAHPGEIHLLITDLVMPEMNGRQLSDELHTLFPKIKSLFMSGYTANVIAHHGVLEEGVHFIQKPFSMKELAKKTRAALDHPQTPPDHGPRTLK